MKIPAIVTDHSVTVFANGNTLTARASHPNFTAIRDALKAGETDSAKIAAMFDVPKAIEAKTDGRVTIRDGRVFHDGTEIHSTLATRMVNMLAEGFDVAPLSRFLERLMGNPSRRAVEGLYDFLAAANIPITPDGKFLAYKKVRADYLDIHSGTIRNAIGDEPSLPRNRVDEDPDRTCSHGLHVCSESYLPHFGGTAGERVMVVEVDPADVVAIPRDYNNAKMRVCRYKVVGELPASRVAKAFDRAVMSGENFMYGDMAENDLSSRTLGGTQTDVIKNVGGLPVRFVHDEEDGWTAQWHSHTRGYDSYSTEEPYEWYSWLDSLEDAVANFVAKCVATETVWKATVVWLDEDGERHEEEVTVEVDAEEADVIDPDEFFSRADDNGDVFPEGSVVLNLRKTGTRTTIYG